MSQTKATTNSSTSPTDALGPPEVVVRAQCRQFSASEKERILAEADAYQKAGEIGALLRREGIYASYLTQWRREREAGQLRSNQAVKRGCPCQAEATHVALGLLTPAMVHFGQAQTILAQRQATLDQAYPQHLERFVRSAPATPPFPRPFRLAAYSSPDDWAGVGGIVACPHLPSPEAGH
jgi:transposase